MTAQDGYPGPSSSHLQPGEQRRNRRCLRTAGRRQQRGVARRDAAQGIDRHRRLGGDEGGAHWHERARLPVTGGGEDRREKCRIDRSASTRVRSEWAEAVMIQWGKRARQWPASFVRASRQRCRPAAPSHAPGGIGGDQQAQAQLANQVHQSPALCRIAPPHHHEAAVAAAGGRRRAQSAGLRSSVNRTKGIHRIERRWCLGALVRRHGISQNLADILARIEAARKAAIESTPATRLVAVSKTVEESGIPRSHRGAGQRFTAKTGCRKRKKIRL